MATSYVPKFWTDTKAQISRIATTVNLLLGGAHNEVHDITMSAASATTRFPAGTDMLRRITPSTIPILIPTHLNACTLLYDFPWIFWAVTISDKGGALTFTHGGAGGANCDFKLLLFGD